MPSHHTPTSLSHKTSKPVKHTCDSQTGATNTPGLIVTGETSWLELSVFNHHYSPKNTPFLSLSTPIIPLKTHLSSLSQLPLTSSVFPSFHLQPVPAGIIFHLHAVPSVVLLQCHTSAAETSILPLCHPSYTFRPSPSILHLPSFTVPQLHHPCSHRRHLSCLHTIRQLHRPSAHQEHSWMKFDLKWVEYH